MTDEKCTTIYLAVDGKILQIHLHGVTQMMGGSQLVMKLFEYKYECKKILFLIKYLHLSQCT